MEDQGMLRRVMLGLGVALIAAVAVCPLAVANGLSGAGDTDPAVSAEATAASAETAPAESNEQGPAVGASHAEENPQTDPWSTVFVFVLATFIGLGVILRVSRLLHTPLMSLTNAISAIAVVGSIIVTGSDYPRNIRLLGAIALFCSMTNIVSGFLITDRMLKMFKQQPRGEVKK
jgi:NAD(P) transhydrogenase subunit alpha